MARAGLARRFAGRGVPEQYARRREWELSVIDQKGCSGYKANAQPHKYPRWVEFVASLPKTATGEIRRHKLRQRAPGRGK